MHTWKNEDTNSVDPMKNKFSMQWTICLNEDTNSVDPMRTQIQHAMDNLLAFFAAGMCRHYIYCLMYVWTNARL